MVDLEDCVKSVFTSAGVISVPVPFGHLRNKDCSPSFRHQIACDRIQTTVHQSPQRCFKLQAAVLGYLEANIKPNI